MLLKFDFRGEEFWEYFFSNDNEQDWKNIVFTFNFLFFTYKYSFKINYAITEYKLVIGGANFGVTLDFYFLFLVKEILIFPWRIEIWFPIFDFGVWMFI